MANYTCSNGHTWSGKSNLSKGFSYSELRCPEVGCGLPAEPKLKARAASGPGLKAEAESPVLAEAHARFTSLVTEWPCWFSWKVEGHKRRPDHTCWGPKDPHHLIPADWILRSFRGLLDPELADILYAPIIGVPLCRIGHEAVEARVSEFIYWDELDPELVVWCRRIEAKYPDRPPILERLKLESPMRKAAA